MPPILSANQHYWRTGWTTVNAVITKTIPFRLDRHSTSAGLQIRPTTNQSKTYVTTGLLHCGLNEQTGRRHCGRRVSGRVTPLHGVNNRTVEQLPLAASHPPLGCRAFIGTRQNAERSGSTDQIAIGQF